MKRGGSILKLFLRLAICGLLLLWAFHSIFQREARSDYERRGAAFDELAAGERIHAAWTIGPRVLGRHLATVSVAHLCGSFGLVGLTVVLGAVRWHMVMRVAGIHLPPARTARISLVAQFFNSFLLGSTGGDLLKAYYAARETHHRKTEAVTTVFVDRLIGLGSMLVFACLMMLPNLALLREHERLAAVAGAVVLMMLACIVVLGLAFWGGLTRLWSGARAFLRRLPKGEHLERSLDACRQFGRAPGFLLNAFLLSMLVNLIVVVQGLVLCAGLGATVSFTALLVIVPIIICLSALPITPSGLGVRENLFVLMLAVPEINVEPAKALSLSLLFFAGGLVWSLVGGAVYVARRDREHLADVARE